MILLLVAVQPSGGESNGIAPPSQIMGYVGEADLDQAVTPIIHTPAMNIHYQVNSIENKDLERIELWYAIGWGDFWQLYDYDEDKISPIVFVAPGEGIYRFLVVAVDRWGRRSYEGDKKPEYPQSNLRPVGVKAHLAVFIDYSKPQLYLYSPRGEVKDYQSNELKIRWQGFDAHLAARPVTLYYQSPENAKWEPISGPQPDQGEYNWNIPNNLSSPFRIRAVLADQAGNYDIQYSGQIYLSRQSEEKASPSNEGFPQESQETVEGEAGAAEHPIISEYRLQPKVTDSNKLERSNQCFVRGMMYSQRFEWAKAADAFQESLENNPHCLSSRINLANALYKMCEFEKALAAYERCLQEDPARSSALFGLAQSQIALKQHDQAQKTLTRLLEQDRRDWQAWLMYGDTSQELGKLDVAINSWRQAANGDAGTARRAQERLEQYQP